MFEDDNRMISKILHDNDESAANKLISKYYKKVYKDIYMRVSDKELAMDLTQETFISMLKGLYTYDCSKSAFKTWLLKIAGNKVIDYSRSRQHHEKTVTQTLEGYDKESNHNLENDTINQLAASQIYETLDHETIQTRNIFELKAGQGYTFEEISRLLEMPEGTVKSRYYAVIKKMRKELNSYE